MIVNIKREKPLSLRINQITIIQTNHNPTLTTIKTIIIIQINPSTINTKNIKALQPLLLLPVNQNIQQKNGDQFALLKMALPLYLHQAFSSQSSYSKTELLYQDQQVMFFHTLYQRIENTLQVLIVKGSKVPMIVMEERDHG